MGQVRQVSHFCSFPRSPHYLMLFLMQPPNFVPLGLFSGSSSHSLKVLFFAISEPNQRLSYSIVLGYVDSQIFARYDSNSREIQPQVSWMEKLRKDIPQYWQALTNLVHAENDMFRNDLEDWRSDYNKDKGE
uniref:MHC class I-like antigen recognition-like domain-containing protein n=1 Tax=Pseudonaja textilis TaxID=8673 RepID=A0A670Z3L1_PSETE